MSVFFSFCGPYLSHKSVGQNVWPILRLQSYVRLTSHKRRTRGPERRRTLTIRLRYSFRQARLLVEGGGLQWWERGTEVWVDIRVFAVHRWFMFTTITTHTHIDFLFCGGRVVCGYALSSGTEKRKRKKHGEHTAPCTYAAVRKVVSHPLRENNETIIARPMSVRTVSVYSNRTEDTRVTNIFK